MNFGMNLKNIRKATGYTQKQVADRLGLTAQAVSKWENNVNEPDMGQIAVMCLMFGCTTDDLTGHETAPLSAEERELVSLYRKVPEDVKDIVLTVLRSRTEVSS